MSDDDIEETQPRGLFSLFNTPRKIILTIAVGFIFWTYISQAMNPAHPRTATQKAEKKVKETPKDTTDSTTTAVAPPSTALVATPVVNTPAATNHDEEIEHLHQQVEALQAKSQNPTAEADKEHVAQLEKQIAEQEKSLQELKAQVAEIQSLKTQMGDITTQNNRKLSALTALSILKESLHNGEAFTVPFNQLAKLVPTDAKNNAQILELLEKLKPYSEHGIPTWSALQNQFSELLPVALVPDHQDNSWKQNLQSLIRIRKEGEQQQGSDDEAILARAEAKISYHDLPAALKEVESLSKPAADALAPWTTNAKALLDASSVVDALQIALVAEPND